MFWYAAHGDGGGGSCFGRCLRRALPTLACSRPLRKTLRGGLGCLGVGGMTRREAREALRDALGKPGLMVLTVADMARVTGVCEKTVRRRVDAGEIRSSSEFDGKRIRIPIDEAVRYCMV